MLPQLAVSTFPSQIFWVLLGFICVFTFMSLLVSPKLRSTLENRSNYIDNLLKEAEVLKKETDIIVSSSLEEFNQSKQSIIQAENDLSNELKKKNSKKKRELYKNSLDRLQNEKEKIKEMSEKTLNELSANLDDLISLAMDKFGYK